MRGQEAARSARERKAVMATLAAIQRRRHVRNCGTSAGLPSEAELLRGPETGLVMVRGRIGGGGAPFNLGEATVTRATVRLAPAGRPCLRARPRPAEGPAGGDRRRALAGPGAPRRGRDQVLSRRCGPRWPTPTNRRRAETAATRVDFFTMVRGED